MGVYISRAALEINGQEITDFKSVTDKTITYNKPVHLMYKTGSTVLTQRFLFDVDYVVPQSDPYDFSQVKGGTFTIEYDNGDRTDFGGVSIISVGDGKVDGENELVKVIEFMAETKNGIIG
jgi:hypothetical protein